MTRRNRIKKQPVSVAPAPPARLRRRRQRRQGNGRSQNQIERIVSNSGFLKCAFAPNDFADTGFTGIPDNYNGRVFATSSVYTDTITVPAGETAVLLLAPSPAVSHYRSKSGGFNGKFYPAFYADADQIFPQTHEAIPNVSQFRFVSNTLELTNVTENLNQGGAISVANAPLKLSMEQMAGSGGHGSVRYAVEGMPSSITANAYVDKGQNGIYTVACNTESEFGWHEALAGLSGAVGTDSTIVPLGRREYDDQSIDPEAMFMSHPPGQPVGTNSWIMKGWDNCFNTKIVLIAAPASEAQTYVLKTTQCVEYRPVPDTLLWKVAHASPRSNPAELALYHEIATELPVAVPRDQNAGFWDFIKKTAKTVSGVLSHVPGPIGMIATGIRGLFKN